MAGEVLPEVKPRPHQEAERAHHFDPGRAWFWTMRSGKSWSAVDLADTLHASGEIRAVLIVAPRSMVCDWLGSHWPRSARTPYTGVTWISADRHRRYFRQELVELVGDYDGRLKVLALNPEALLQDDARRAIAHLVHTFPTLLIVDEAHDYRRPGSKRSRRLRGIARDCPYRRILTGTPVADNDPGLWAMYNLAVPEWGGYRTQRDYLDRFYIEHRRPGRSGGQYVKRELRDDRAEELRQLLAATTSVVLRKDIPRLSGLQFSRHFFDLPDAVKLFYERLRTLDPDTLADMGDALSPASLLVKLQQVASGWVNIYGEPRTLASPKNCSRLAALADVLDRRPTVIWCAFRHDIDRVRASLGVPSVELSGNVTRRAQEVAKAAFQKPDGPRILVGQPQAGGVGTDLSRAEHVVWYSLTNRSGLYDQANERGSELDGEPVDITTLVARRTVDERLVDLLERKRDLADWLAGRGLQETLAALGGGFE